MTEREKLGKRIEDGTRALNAYDEKSDGMRVIVGPVASGKTYGLLKEANHYNGCIVVGSKTEVNYWYNKASYLGYQINKPVTYEECLEGKVNSPYDSIIHIDNLACFLNVATNFRVGVCTLQSRFIKNLAPVKENPLFNENLFDSEGE